MAIFLAIIFGLIAFICGVFLIKRGIEKDIFIYEILGFSCCIFSPFIATFIYSSIIDIPKINDTPQAIDVYRGNTTLQITYQDSIPVDSVVIFKNKRHESKSN